MAISESGRIKIKTDGIYHHNDTTNQYDLVIKMGKDYANSPASGNDSVFVADSYDGIGSFTKIEGAYSQVQTVQGKNLIKNSETLSGHGDFGTDTGNITVTYESSYTRITATAAGTRNVYWDNFNSSTIERIEGETYTVSFDVRTSKPMNLVTNWYDSHYPSDYSTPTAKTNEWERISFTYIKKINTSHVNLFGFLCASWETGETLDVRNIQLEKNASATAYEAFVPNSPSPDYPSIPKFLGDEGSLNFKSSQCKPAASILNNGGFEQGLDGWQDLQNPSTAKISAEAHSGNNSLDIIASKNSMHIVIQSFKTVKNHKYKLCGFIKVKNVSLNDAAGISMGLSDWYAKADITKLNTWQYVETPIYTADTDDYEMGVVAAISTVENSAGAEALFDDLSLVDLTAENAVDAVVNEVDGKLYAVTTTKQTKNVALSNPLRALPNGIKDVYRTECENLFDEVLEHGDINYYTGLNANSAGRIRSKNFTAVLPNTQYTLKRFRSVPTANIGLRYYDVNENIISGGVSGKDIVTFTTPSNCCFVRFIDEANNLSDIYFIGDVYFTSPSWVRRIGYGRILSDNISFVANNTANTNLINFVVTGISNVKINSSILCTHFVDGKSLGNISTITEHISGYGDATANFGGSILKSRLSSADMAGVKAWFDSNSVYIAYESAVPIATAADNITFKSYGGATLISFENAIKPSSLEISYPNILVKGMSDYINDNSRNMSARVNVLLNDSSTLVLSGNDLMQSGFKVSGGVTASGKFEVGDAVSTKLSLILNNFKDNNSAGKFDKTDFSGSIIKPFTDITVPADLNATPQRAADTTISIPLGVFYLDEYNSQGNTINLSAYDGLFLFDIPYSKITTTVYPATFSKIVTDICSYIGVQLENIWFPHWSTLVEKKPDTKDLTCRQMLSYVAQLAGCFVKCNRYGDIRFEWFMPQTMPINDGTINGNTDLSATDTLNGNTDLSATDSVNGNVQIINRLDPTDYGYFDIPFISDYSSDSAGGSPITGVEYVPENSDGAITRTGTDAYVLSIENNPLVQDNVDIFVKSLADEIVGFIVRNINIKTLDNPLLETGANARFTDKLGNVIIFPITSLSYQFGEYSQLGADCESQASNGSTLSYDSNSKIQRYMSQISQNGISKYEKMIMDTNTFLASAAGFYETKIYDDKTGDVIEYYQHNLPNLADSTMILKVTVDGIFESKDKGQTYTSIVESDGRSNITQLASRIIVANLIRTGKLQSMNGLSEFDLDTGLFDYGNGTFKLEKNSDVELDNDYMLTTRGLVRAISEVKDRESEKAKTVTATLGTRLEISQNDFVKSTATVNDLDSQGILLTSSTHIVSDYISIQSVPDYPLEVRYKFKCDEAFVIDGVYLFDVNKNCLVSDIDKLKLILPQEVYYLRFKIRKYDSSTIALSDLDVANVICGPLNTQVGELRFEGTDVDGNTLQLGQLMGYGIPNSGYSGFELHGDLGVRITGGLTADADIYVNKTGNSNDDRLVFNQGNLQSGSVNITPSAANTPTNATVTFPIPFNTAPIVVATPVTGGPGTYVKGVAVLGASTTQCTIVLTRADMQVTTINWIAVGT